jgi:hypothetical protein
MAATVNQGGAGATHSAAMRRYSGEEKRFGAARGRMAGTGTEEGYMATSSLMIINIATPPTQMSRRARVD